RLRFACREGEGKGEGGGGGAGAPQNLGPGNQRHERKRPGPRADLSAGEGRADMSRQFLDFTSAVEWMVGKMSGQQGFRLRRCPGTDPVKVVCIEVLHACQDFGLDPRSIASTRPMSLAPGYGPAVVEVLSFLAQALLERKGNQ
ncbi:unnamed protein product, partial [Discosporangium mesarthrocarpum]